METLFHINNETFCLSKIFSISDIKNEYSPLHFKGRLACGFYFKIQFDNGNVEKIKERIDEFDHWQERMLYYTEPWDTARKKVSKSRDRLMFVWGKYCSNK